MILAVMIFVIGVAVGGWGVYLVMKDYYEDPDNRQW